MRPVTQPFGIAVANAARMCAALWPEFGTGTNWTRAKPSNCAAFCRRLDRYHTPVIAILDFPRRDRVQRALECGAAAVLGKPWRVDDLLATIELNLHSSAQSDGHTNNRAA